VAPIQELIPEERWRYVSTQQNPADLVTRGISVDDYKDKSLWWHGPSWLRSSSETWPREEAEADIVEERRVFITSVTSDVVNDLLLRFSSFTRLVRVTAYCLRWLRGTKLIRGNPLFKSELDNCSRHCSWLSIVQKYDFSKEYSALSKGDQVSRGSPLSALRPLFSTDGLIRVGGRLALSSMDYAEKHPIVLAKDSHLSLLLVREAL